MELSVRFADGSTIHTYSIDWETAYDVLRHLREYASRPSWVQIGDVVCFSQNIVSIEALPDEDEGGSESQ